LQFSYFLNYLFYYYQTTLNKLFYHKTKNRESASVFCKIYYTFYFRLGLEEIGPLPFPLPNPFPLPFDLILEPGHGFFVFFFAILLCIYCFNQRPFLLVF